jgi:predicted nucleotidyltransferase
MSFGISDNVLDDITYVFAKYKKIDKAVLYGSRAKGNYKAGSDIDIAIFSVDINLTELNKLSTELDDLLLPYIFDLTIHQQIKNKDLLEHISRVGVEIYKRE